MTELLMYQILFAKSVPRLIDKAFELGYEVVLGDAFRDPRVHGAVGVKVGYGHAKSAHKRKLALDLLLFKHGKYLTSTEDYKLLGEWWEKQNPKFRWGGRFADGNHFSIEFEGMK